MLVSRRIVRIRRLGLLRALKQAPGRADPEKNADYSTDREIEHSGIEHCPKSVTHSQPFPSSGAGFDQMSAPFAGCRGHPPDHATVVGCCRTVAPVGQMRGATDAANAPSPQAGFICVITHQHRNGLQRVRYPRGQYRNHPRHTACCSVGAPSASHQCAARCDFAAATAGAPASRSAAAVRVTSRRTASSPPDSSKAMRLYTRI
jgi:hypothetical protein